MLMMPIFENHESFRKSDAGGGLGPKIMKFARWRDFNACGAAARLGGRDRRGAGLKSPQRFIFLTIITAIVEIRVFVGVHVLSSATCPFVVAEWVL